MSRVGFESTFVIPSFQMEKKMRFIHIADVHLGAEPDAGTAYSGKRPQELWDTFGKVISICEQEKIDLLLIAGDLFHRQPLLRELKEANYLFESLTHTKVVFIAGNHDYIANGSYYRTFSWNENVYFLSDREMDYVLLEDLNTAVYGFSYDTREIREPRYDRIRAGKVAEHEILLAHGGDEKHIPIRRSALESPRFDYIALGHIHKPQEVIPQKAVYAGALEPVDRNDTGKHGFIRGEIRGHAVKVSFVPLAKREYRQMELEITPQMTMGSIRSWIGRIIEEEGKENLYKFIVKGFRDADLWIDPEGLKVSGNVLEILDETKVAYDLAVLQEKNKENLIGCYIRKFAYCEAGSVEEQALYEGVQALMESRRE